MIGYLDGNIASPKPLVLILPKTSGYVKTCKDKGEYKNNNKLITLYIDGDKLLEKYNTTWTKIKGLKEMSSIVCLFMNIYIYKNNKNIWG